MRRVTRTLSAEELADESGVSRDRIDWLIDIRVLKPVAAGTFRFGDVFRVKMDKGPSKSAVAVAHERLPDADEAETTKLSWRERLSDLKSFLES
jgi:hypothetical protein